MPRRFTWVAALALLAVGCMPNKEALQSEGKLPPIDQLETAINAKNDDEARQLIEKVLTGPDRDLPTYIKIREFYAKARRNRDGVAIMERALTDLHNLSDKDKAVVNRYVAGDSYAAGDFKRALSAYQDAYRLDPASEPIQNDYAFFLADSGGDLKLAKSLIDTALAKNPSSANDLDTMGWVLLKQKEPAKAVTYLEKAVTADKTKLEVRYHLGIAYETLGRKDDAAKQYMIVVRNNVSHDKKVEDAATRLKAIDMKLYAKATSVKNGR